MPALCCWVQVVTSASSCSAAQARQVRLSRLPTPRPRVVEQPLQDRAAVAVPAVLGKHPGHGGPPSHPVGLVTQPAADHDPVKLGEQQRPVGPHRT